MKQYITSFCSIGSGKVIVNEQLLFSGDDRQAADFLKVVYKNFKFNYPKFYKMDNLSKLAIIASELLLQANPLKEKYKDDEISIIIANSSSSLEIDTEHQATISDKTNYFPSPAIFVYTLPNILIGEIAIRNSIKGENSLFIFEDFNTEFLHEYVNTLFNQHKTASCIAGYVDYFENRYRAFLYTVENTTGVTAIEHTNQNIKQLFNK